MYDEPNSAFLHGGLATEADIQKRYYEEGLIYTLQIESTLRCSQGCVYCYASSTPNSPENLSSEDIKQILIDASEIEVRCIDWLGGDPLVRSDWYELMDFAQSLGLVNNIWTSGLPLANQTIAKRAVDVTKNGGFISVHLDSLNPAIYQKVHQRRVHENIKAILSGLNNVINWGKSTDEVWNCITLTKTVAENDVYNTMEWFWKEKGIRTVLTLYNPVASTAIGLDLEPSQEMIQKAYRGRDELLYEDESFSSMDVSKFYCGSMICITNDGYYTPCSVIRTTKFGHYKELSLKELQKENPGDILMMKLRNPQNLPKPCIDCENNSVCFGCRSSAFYYSGDMFGCDPKCPKCHHES